GAKYVMRHLYQIGVWAIFSTLDPSVLQYKPGLLMTPELCEELLERTEAGISRAAAEAGRRTRGSGPAGSSRARPGLAGSRPAGSQAGGNGAVGSRAAGNGAAGNGAVRNGRAG